MNTTMHFRKYLVGAVVMSLMLFSSGIAEAQTVVSSPVSSIPCTALSYNLHFGQYDPVAVVSLQNFLAMEGYFSFTSTGFFGPITLAAVTTFQSHYGIPTTGFVGPITRAEIQSLSCGVVNPPPPTPGPISIFSIDPNVGPVGTTVALTGRGFSDSNTVFFNGGSIGTFPSSPGIAIACTTDPSCVPGIRQTITFSVPSYIAPYCPPGAYCAQYLRQVTPGTYPVYVTNQYGTSNTMQFVVTGNTQNTPLVISGIDAPNSIPMNTPATWTVRVASNNVGTLHYSVVWGDEQQTMSGNIMAPTQSNILSAATFTHAYSHSGTFTPTFTVTDDFGHSVTSSATVLVTPIY